MQISYHETKNQANLVKHGLPLSDAELLEWDLMDSKVDARRDYGEVRRIGIAPIGARLYCVVYTERDDKTHIISLRKAHKKEVADYVNDTI
jgi:uncharacterized protein